MALTFVKRNDLPVATKGKSAPPSVAITENGQITFSSLASAALGTRALVKVAVAHDPETGKISVVPKGHKLVAKFPEEGFFDLRWSKEKSKNGKANPLSATISSATGLLKKAEYDYKKSGQQSFAVTSDGGVLSFMLPKGSLTPKPKTNRKKRGSGTNSNAAAAGGPVIPPTPTGEQEIVLEV